MSEELTQQVLSRALGHLLLDEVSRLVDEQTVPPEDLNVIRLTDEVGLVRQNDGHEPARVGKCHETTRSGYVAGKSLHQVEEESGSCIVTVKDIHLD